MWRRTLDGWGYVSGHEFLEKSERGSVGARA